MRYFFTFFGVMIVWRAFSWLRKDRRATHRRLRQLPDAGTIGILTVEQGSKSLPAGSVIPVPHEGVMGYLRTCDVVVPVEDVATEHLAFTFQDGEGVYVFPRRGCEAVVDGVLLQSRRDGLRHPMQHGSTLMIGQVVLRLGVFAGLNVQEARAVVYYPEYMPAEQPPEEYPQEFYIPVDQPLNPPPQWQGGDGDVQ